MCGLSASFRLALVKALRNLRFLSFLRVRCFPYNMFLRLILKTSSDATKTNPRARSNNTRLPSRPNHTQSFLPMSKPKNGFSARQSDVMNWSIRAPPSDDTAGTVHFTDAFVLDSIALAEYNRIINILRRQLKGTWQFSFNKIEKENGYLLLRLAFKGVFPKTLLSTLEFFVGTFAKIPCFHGVEFDITAVETAKKTPEMLEATLAALLNAVETDTLISLRLVLPQYKRLIKFYNNHFDTRIKFIHIVGEPPIHINRPASTTGHRRKNMGSFQSLVQRSLRIPFYEICGDPVSNTILYKSDTLHLKVNRHIDLQGPVYAANDLQIEPSSRYLAPTHRRLIASSPNLLSFHSNNSGLTLNKVTAIQSALDDNKSPTFGESQESLMANYTQKHNNSHSVVRSGWLILLSTWIIVIVGIASMLGLWDNKLEPIFSLDPEDLSRARYEKETGYPIPGYYSCLVFMTFIASWVWCIISWMGMKFFRHTKGGLAHNTKGT